MIFLQQDLDHLISYFTWKYPLLTPSLILYLFVSFNDIDPRWNKYLREHLKKVNIFFEPSKPILDYFEFFEKFDKSFVRKPYNRVKYVDKLFEEYAKYPSLHNNPEYIEAVSSLYRLLLSDHFSISKYNKFIEKIYEEFHLGKYYKPYYDRPIGPMTFFDYYFDQMYNNLTNSDIAVDKAFLKQFMLDFMKKYPNNSTNSTVFSGDYPDFNNTDFEKFKQELFEYTGGGTKTVDFDTNESNLVDNVIAYLKKKYSQTSDFIIETKDMVSNYISSDISKSKEDFSNISKITKYAISGIFKGIDLFYKYQKTRYNVDKFLLNKLYNVYVYMSSGAPHPEFVYDIPHLGMLNTTVWKNILVIIMDFLCLIIINILMLKIKKIYLYLILLRLLVKTLFWNLINVKSKKK